MKCQFQADSLPVGAPHRTGSAPARISRKRGLWCATALAGSLSLTFGSAALALPTGGAVSAGAASFSSGPGALTVSQSSQNVAINWMSFNIAANEAVTFVQPNSNAVALNRVIGTDPSAILGSLSSNGKVFLINPNGILFGKGAQVNVGGLVASTLDITDADFMAGRYKFAGPSSGVVENDGSIHADVGYVALLGANVGNNGLISAKLGAVALAAGNAVTLDVAGNGLLNVTVNKGALNALAQNGGLISADGGQVLMTAVSASMLIRSAVNNTGVIEARTLQNRKGVITLMGDMGNGTVNVAGTLDASAPNGGDGGSIETSASKVNIADAAVVTTAALSGKTGTYSIDPFDFTIAPTGGDISGATLSALLVTNSVSISTTSGSNATVPGTPPVTSLHSTTPGNGDINVNDAVSWTAAPSTTTLTLTASRDVNVNFAVTATNGNFVVCCGRDINVNAAITTTNGSVLLSAGRNETLAATGAMTTTDGNITLCAGFNITIGGAITLTRGSTIPAQDLGLALGMTIIAGNAGTGPGTAGGTVIFASGAPPVTVTGPNAPVVIDYNPSSYATPTNYGAHFTLTNGATLKQFMLVYPSANKVFDGTNTAVLSGFNSTVASGLPTGVTLVAGPSSTAVYDSSAVGSGIGITFTGYSLAGANAGNYALASACCTTGFKTAGAITAPPPPPPPPVPCNGNKQNQNKQNENHQNQNNHDDDHDRGSSHSWGGHGW